MAIVIPILAEFNPRGIKQAEKSLAGFTSRASGALNNLARLGQVALVGFGVARITEFGFGLVKAGEAALQSDRRLAQINRTMGLFGPATGLVTKRMLEYADSVSAATGIDDDQIKAVQAKLATFKELAKTAVFTGGAFDRATKAAIDLAAAGFGDAAGNAVQLGKALQDPLKGITALSRAGVTFTKAEQKKIKEFVKSNQLAKAQEVILRALETQVGGTAEATATATGKMAVAFDNLKEDIGQALLPTFEKLASFATGKLIPAIKGIIEAFQAGGLGAAAKKAAGYLKPVISKLVELGKAMGRWVVDEGLPMLYEGLKKLGEALVDWISPRIKPAIAKLGEWGKKLVDWIINTGIPLLAATMSKVGDLLVGWIEPRIEPALAELGVYFERVAEYIIVNAVPALGHAFNALQAKLVEWIARLIPETLRGLGRFVTGFLDELPAAFQGVLAKMSDLGTQIAITLVVETIRGVAQLPDLLIKSIGDMTAKITKFGAAIGKAIVNGIIGVWNLLDLQFPRIEVPWWVPGIGGKGFGGFDLFPDIPALAAGGIVTSPTLALIGERGPEAVVPLNRSSGNAMGNVYNINISGAIDPTSTARQVREVLNRDSQRRGTGTILS